MREFSISAAAQTVVGSTTLVWINPAAAPNPNLEFLRYWVGQAANATSAQQRIQIRTQVTSFPTVVSSTPTKLKPSDPNLSVITGSTTGGAGTAGVNASAEGGGTTTAVWDDAFNVLNGWLHVPTPAETRIMPASFASGLGLTFPVIPATASGWAFGLVYREV